MESYEKKSEEASSDADRLEDAGERVEGQIEETKSDWQAKQGQASVPGAIPGPDEEEQQPTEVESEDGESSDSPGQ